MIEKWALSLVRKMVSYTTKSPNHQSNAPNPPIQLHAYVYCFYDTVFFQAVLRVLFNLTQPHHNKGMSTDTLIDLQPLLGSQSGPVEIYEPLK